MAENKGRREISRQQVEVYKKAHEQLATFHADVEKLSNKKPDGPLNAFKLRYINQVLDTVNHILGDEYRPFPDFTLFDVQGSMPTASDVVMMLSHYRKALTKYRDAHQRTITRPNKHFKDHEDRFIVWNLSDGDPDETGKTEEPEGES